jgi:hypothetical protein
MDSSSKKCASTILRTSGGKSWTRVATRSEAVESVYVCIQAGGRPSQRGMLEPLLPPDVPTVFIGIRTFQGWCLNPHIRNRIGGSPAPGATDRSYTASVTSSCSMPYFGLLEFTLAAAAYRLAFGISGTAAFTSAAGSELYSFMRLVSTATMVFLELDRHEHEAEVQPTHWGLTVLGCTEWITIQCRNLDVETICDRQGGSQGNRLAPNVPRAS